jgi:PAS domain S-box-containing protein
VKPILIIAPHSKIELAAKKVASNYEDIDVKTALLGQAIEIVKSAKKEGVEAIIARGGTAKIIERVVPSIPVIELQVSPYDLLSAVNSAKKYGKNIFIIGFKNIIDGVQLLGPILDTNIHAYLMKSEEDGRRYIKNLIDSGRKIDALLGGAVAENLAFGYNIPTVLLETSDVTVDSSIKEAKRIVEIARKEKEKAEQFKAVLHYINEGVISIDSSLKVTTINPAAAKVIGVSSENAIGRSIDELIPNTRLDEVIESSEPQLGKLMLINKTQVLANRVPIIAGNKTVGAVATFQDVTKIQEYEQKIRAKLIAKGHVAKYSLSDIIGESDLLLKAKEKAKKYARNNSTVLIVGESGTGKEMFAQ